MSTPSPALEFSEEFSLPLSTIAGFVDLIEAMPLPEAASEALGCVRDNVEHLREMIEDWRELARIECGAARPVRSCTALQPWLEQTVARVGARARQSGHRLELKHRSFLPNVVEIDPVLAARALDALLRAVLHRAIPGPIAVGVAYDLTSGAEERATLRIEIGIVDGEWPDDVGAGAADAAGGGTQRPSLGLAMARRLCQALGGDVRREADGPGASFLRFSIPAPPARLAAWVDPLDPQGMRLAAVRPGRLLFAAGGREQQLLYGHSLRHAGYSLEVVDRGDLVLQRLAVAREPYDAIVLNPQLPVLHGRDVARLARERGFHGPIVAILTQGGADDRCATIEAGCDVVLQPPFTGRDLLAALAEVAGQAGGAAVPAR